MQTTQQQQTGSKSPYPPLKTSSQKIEAPAMQPTEIVDPAAVTVNIGGGGGAGAGESSEQARRHEAIAQAGRKNRVSQVDSLYISGTIISALASALSFGTVILTGVDDNRIAQSYLAFAFIYLIVSHIETIILIVGLTKTPEDRMKTHSSAIALTVLNIIFLIIAIACEATGIGINYPSYIQFAPASLLVALCLMAILFLLQSVAQSMHAKNEPEVMASFHPLDYNNSMETQKHVVAHACLTAIALSFAYGSLYYFTLVSVPGFVVTSLANGGMAMAFFFCIFSIIAMIFGVLALCPSLLVSAHHSLVVSWIFSLLALCAAIAGFIIQLVEFEISLAAILYIGIGWVIEIVTMSVGITAYLMVRGKTCANCCDCEDPQAEVERERALVELEKAKLTAATFRRQREKLERGQLETA